MKKYPCIESTEDFTVGHFIVRLWIDESEVEEDYDNSDIVKYAEEAWNLSMKELAEYLAGFPRVNAVQVKYKGNPRSSGVMIYCVEF